MNMPPPPNDCFTFSQDTINWFPVLLGAVLYIWSYYAYVGVFVVTLVSTDAERIFYGVGFHVLLGICLWCYLRTIVTRIPIVPRYFHLSEAEYRLLGEVRDDTARRSYLEGLGQNRGILTRGRDGSVRYCDACRLIKPDRCHHCSTCRTCVPKMDHHCPWFNNCVCFSTYKFFLLTLFYLISLSLFTMTTTMVYAKSIWDNVSERFGTTFHVTFLTVLSGAMAFGLVPFLYFHMTMVFANETTLEGMRGPMFSNPSDSFDIGLENNFAEVFGRNRVLWLLPVFTSIGDGFRFPTRLFPNRNAIQNPV